MLFSFTLLGKFCYDSIEFSSVNASKQSCKFKLNDVEGGGIGSVINGNTSNLIVK
jgi:hypothetical protein